MNTLPLPALLLAPLLVAPGPAQHPAVPAAKAPATGTPQQPGARPPTAADGRKALAERVTKAHRGDSKVVIDRYRATITLIPLGKGKDSVNVELDVRYGRHIARSKDATAEMIRYSVNEGDKPMERGKDPRPWVRIGKEVSSLSGRHESTDADLLESHTRLCRQMLEFLDAGKILAALEGDQPVTSQPLKISRTETLQTDFINGKLKTFPVFRKDRQKVRQEAVFLDAWVDKATARLVQVRIFPLTDKGAPDRAHGELVMLRNYSSNKGVLVPRELLIYDVVGDTPKPQVKVALTTIDLNADLSRSDFMRPR